MMGNDRWAGHAARELTTAKVLRERAEQYQDKVFLTYLPDGRQFTYRDIDLELNRIAHGLAGLHDYVVQQTEVWQNLVRTKELALD